MMSTDIHRVYLEGLLKRPDIGLLGNGQISVIVTGSSADDRADDNSDWDYKIFAEEAEIKLFLMKYGAKFSISDNAHNPKVFVVVRSFEYLESELNHTLAVTLWICERAKVLRDDEKAFRRRIMVYRTRFEDTLLMQIQSKYLKLRTRRHGIDGMVRRYDIAAVRMLAQDCIKISLQILHLLHGQPYPYPEWLHRISRDQYSRNYPELFKSIEMLGSESNLSQIQLLSRSLIGNVIDAMVVNGFERTQLEQWWMSI